MTKLPFAGGKYFGWRKWEEISSTITSLYISRLHESHRQHTFLEEDVSGKQL
jgi:hypothetical protein